LFSASEGNRETAPSRQPDDRSLGNILPDWRAILIKDQTGACADGLILSASATGERDAGSSREGPASTPGAIDG
jgi:hypothetical protein